MTNTEQAQSPQPLPAPIPPQIPTPSKEAEVPLAPHAVQPQVDQAQAVPVQPQVVTPSNGIEAAQPPPAWSQEQAQEPAPVQQAQVPQPPAAPIQQAQVPQPPAAPVQPEVAASEPSKNSELPPDEASFIAIIHDKSAAFNSAGNDLAKGGVRNQRKIALCQTLSSRTVEGWTGEIAQLSSNSEGKGVLSLKLADNLRVETTNNSFSDTLSTTKTLIDPGSALFDQLSKLKGGDKVKFSGAFSPSDIDCVQEMSLTLEGSMTDPEFLMHFIAVEAR